MIKKSLEIGDWCVGEKKQVCRVLVLFSLGVSGDGTALLLLAS